MLVYRRNVHCDQIEISIMAELFNLFDEVWGVSDIGFCKWYKLLYVLIDKCGDFLSRTVVAADYRSARDVLLMYFWQKVKCRCGAISRQEIEVYTLYNLVVSQHCV